MSVEGGVRVYTDGGRRWEVQLSDRYLLYARAQAAPSGVTPALNFDLSPRN